MKCSVPGCGNVRTTEVFIQRKFHSFPLDPALCCRWLEAINNPRFSPKLTTVRMTKTQNLRVCSDHFRDEDYHGGQKGYYTALKRGAVPSVFPRQSAEPECAPTTSVSYQRAMPPMKSREMPLVVQFLLNSPVESSFPKHGRRPFSRFLLPGPSGVYTATSPAINPVYKQHVAESKQVIQVKIEEANLSIDSFQDNCPVMDESKRQFRSIGIQVTPPETCPLTRDGEKPTLQYIVDEEAILQLMKNCPMCDRKCRCSKRTCGPYFIVYQSCYFCDYQRKWASQPEARHLSIHKAHTAPKKKFQPEDNVSVNANKTSVSESPVSDSGDPLET